MSNEDNDWMREYMYSRIHEAGEGRRWKRWLRSHYFRAVAAVSGGDLYLGVAEGRRIVAGTVTEPR